MIALVFSYEVSLDAAEFERVYGRRANGPSSSGMAAGTSAPSSFATSSTRRATS